METFRRMVRSIEFDEYLAANIVGRFANIISRLERGLLQNVKEVKPIRTSAAQKLYELRGSFEHASGQLFHWRLYQVEFSVSGSLVIGLHLHRKRIGPTRLATRIMQNLEIERALLFYRNGSSSFWGLKESK